jgi:hypothetical protein
MAALTVTRVDRVPGTRQGRACLGRSAWPPGPSSPASSRRRVKVMPIFRLDHDARHRSDRRDGKKASTFVA